MHEGSHALGVVETILKGSSVLWQLAEAMGAISIG